VGRRFRVGLAGLAVTLLVFSGCHDHIDPDDDLLDGDGGAAPTAVVEPEVSLEEAQDIALEAVGGGQVTAAEIEDLDDVAWVWEVDLVTSTGERRTVSVHVTNGSVVGNELDD